MFLENLLPSGGLYCVAMAAQGGGFRHYFYDTVQSAQNQINALDKSGHTAYIAQASFDTEKIAEAKQHNKALPPGHPKSDRKKVRSQANALYLKNFFLDIDCGEKWPLKNQRQGAAALRQFIDDTGLPFPSVVNSGNGLYAHWVLDKEIPADKWRTVAFLLKRVVATYSPTIGGDSSRTSDSASVLRVPGSHNRKLGKPEKSVVLIKDSGMISFLEFVSVLEKAAKKKKLDCTAVLAPKPAKDINADFYVPQEIVAVAKTIADKCAQLGLMRSSGGNIPEPLWYSCLGVLRFCVDGAEMAHEWSKGHTQYSPAETDAKIAQWGASGTGPATCAKFGGDNTEGCVGCPHNGKIKSPIVLGRPAPEKVKISDDQCAVPDGFRRSNEGLFHEEEGVWFKFYDQDLYPAYLAFDESLGYEVTVIKHKLPYEGTMECVFRSSLVNDPKALLTVLADNHIKVVGFKEKKCMTAYIESYQARLQRHRRMSLLLCQMGWKTARNGKRMFVLGRKIFHEDGAVEDASLARNVPTAAEGFKTSGSLEKWSAATKILGHKNMEPFAFALLAGGFGAPLMKFTGFDGALVSMVGPSGAGKTLMLRMIQSVWGNASDLMMLKNDTTNALISRLGVYGNLPFTIDEITNIDGIDLSNLVYSITQGRDKARLTKNAEERKLMNTWNTLAVTSSNISLLDKLSGAKNDATAELNRVFEYVIEKHPEFQSHVTTDLFWTLNENYGVAGQVYAAWLARNVDKVKKMMETLRLRIEADAEMRGEERFWAAIVTTAVLGGLIAQSLGIIKFPVAAVQTWASGIVRGMRKEKVDLAGDSVGILGQFLDEYASNRLIVKGDPRTRIGCTVVDAPRGPLVVRYELDNRKLFLSRTTFRTWIAKRFGSYSFVKNDLQKIGALIGANKRKVLGAGTFYGTAQQVCWEIDMKCQSLGSDVRQLIYVAKELEKAPPIGEEDCKLPTKKNPQQIK